MPCQDGSKLIQITSPCNADWDQMIGTDRIRFCDHCNLTVHEITEMSPKQVRRLVTKSQGRLCVRYEQRPDPVLLLHHIGRRTARIAAGAFSASLGLTSAFGAALKPPPANLVQGRVVAVKTVSSSQGSGGGVLSGVVSDPQGAVIQSARVTLTNVDTNEMFSTSSDATGTYKFDNLPEGTFKLDIAAQGFASSDIPQIKLRLNDNNRTDQTLSISSATEVQGEPERRITVMGASMMALPEDPLVKAAFVEDLEAVRLALFQKHNPNVRDKPTSSTALEIAVRNANREIVQLLLEAKADVNLRDSSGQTVLMMLGEDATPELVMDLLNGGAKINLRDDDGENALMAAAQVNNVEVLKTLLSAGAKVASKNNDGKTALILAAEAGVVNNVRALLLAGAEINALDKKGKSALTYALENDYSAGARLLKSSGAIAYGLDEDREK